MDWTSFFFGAVSGTLFFLLIGVIATLKWMMPYIRAAQKKPAITQQERNLAKAMMETLEEDDNGWGGNNPWKRWAENPPR